AGPHEPALEEDRDEDRGAFLELVDVHVRAVLPRPECGDRRHRVGGATLAPRGIVGIDAHRARAGERAQVADAAPLALGLAVPLVRASVSVVTGVYESG